MKKKSGARKIKGDALQQIVACPIEGGFLVTIDRAFGRRKIFAKDHKTILTLVATELRR